MLLTLIGKKSETKEVKSFIFKPENKFTFLPGQYIYLTLNDLKYPDPRGKTRQFTVSSSPTEDAIRITTRIRKGSGFKQTLDLLKEGDKIDAEGPSGTFIFDEYEKGNHVFIAGGIGITPFRSMLKYCKDKNLNQREITLLHSVKTPREIIFKKDMENFAREIPGFKLHYTVTQPEKRIEKWKGLTGRINQEMLKRLIRDPRDLNYTFWLCGSPSMVDSVEKLVNNLEIKNINIRSDKFTGY